MEYFTLILTIIGNFPTTRGASYRVKRAWRTQHNFLSRDCDVILQNTGPVKIAIFNAFRKFPNALDCNMNNSSGRTKKCYGRTPTVLACIPIENGRMKMIPSFCYRLPDFHSYRGTWISYQSSVKGCSHYPWKWFVWLICATDSYKRK